MTPCPVCGLDLKLQALTPGLLGIGITCACGAVLAGTVEGGAWRLAVVAMPRNDAARHGLRVIEGGRA